MCCAELESLSLSGNRLRCLPPSLAEASPLTTLDLSNNPEMALTRRSVEAVLCAMSSLCRLKLWGTATLPLTLDYLQTLLPWLEVVTERPPSSGGGSATAEQAVGQASDAMQTSGDSAIGLQ